MDSVHRIRLFGGVKMQRFMILCVVGVLLSFTFTAASAATSEDRLSELGFTHVPNGPWIRRVDEIGTWTSFAFKRGEEIAGYTYAPLVSIPTPEVQTTVESLLSGAEGWYAIGLWSLGDEYPLAWLYNNEPLNYGKSDAKKVGSIVVHDRPGDYPHWPNGPWAAGYPLPTHDAGFLEFSSTANRWLWVSGYVMDEGSGRIEMYNQVAHAPDPGGGACIIALGLLAVRRCRRQGSA